MQDCSYSLFDQVSYTVMIGVPLNQVDNPANYSGVCPESHPYPSDPDGQGDNSSRTNYCCVDPYDEELNECYPTYDETHARAAVLAASINLQRLCVKNGNIGIQI